MNSEKVWLICFANLHFIKLHFCTMNSKKSRSHKRSAFLSFSLSGLYHQDVMIRNVFRFCSQNARFS